MLIRKSKTTDFNDISNLLKNCFGDRDKYGATENLEDRYILVYENNKLIAMTGLIDSSPDYYGSEIDWTCILPEYRGRGIVTKIVSMVIKDCKKDIYCSCWKLHDNSLINLHHCMNTLGFKCVKEAHRQAQSSYHKACDDCIYKLPSGCHCCEDLYVKFADKRME